MSHCTYIRFCANQYAFLTLSNFSLFISEQENDKLHFVERKLHKTEKKKRTGNYYRNVELCKNMKIYQKNLPGNRIKRIGAAEYRWYRHEMAVVGI